jgi:hypothetical protein
VVRDARRRDLYGGEINASYGLGTPNIVMRYLLVTVSENSTEAKARLDSLVMSLGRQAAQADVIVVTRGTGTGTKLRPDNLTLHPIDRPLTTSLSESRNFALAYAKKQGLLDDTCVVAFPDDDCTYPSGLLGEVGHVIADGIGMVCGPYGPSHAEIDRRRFPDGLRPLTPSFVMRVVSSATVFFAGSVVRAVGDFDERFGLGARLGSSEDADYVLRALEAGVSGLYSPQHVFVEHPYKSRRVNQYYVGNVAVLAKHACRQKRLVLSLIHRLSVGAGLAIRRELTVREYVRAIVVAATLACERGTKT